MTSAVNYCDLAGEYDTLLGSLAELTWRQGVLAEVTRLGTTAAAVVDLGAGTGIGGRLMATTCGARRVGVDQSAAMLRRAAGWYDHTVLGDLTGLPLTTASVDLMVSGFDTLNYLHPHALERCLHETSRCLTPQGLLIFDYSSPRLLRVHWRDLRYTDRLPDGTVRWHHRYEPDADRCVSVLERRSHTGSVLWRETHIQYALSRPGLLRLAACAGFRLVRVRDLDGRRYTPTAHTHVWVLRKETT
jgi:ubiquinone/menaquinone biosynthesis C-methylase UbiE